jgi:MoxR-like ATPase
MRDWIKTIAPKTEIAPEKSSASTDSAFTKLGYLREAVETVIKGKSETVKLAVVALLARGHVLIEDVPGVGKTTLWRALWTRSFSGFSLPPICCLRT